VEAKTFEMVAQEAGLDEGTARRYVAYMRARLADEESVQCRVGYAQEWAHRFKAGVEWNASDSDGQAVLRRMFAAGAI